MLRRPDLAEVVGIGDDLGFDFTDAEGRAVHEAVLGVVELLDAFEATAFDEERPPIRHVARTPHGRPTCSDDPLNALITRCVVEPSRSGVLDGQTVVLKDNIAVAGVPMTLGSRVLEGLVPDCDASIVTRLLDAGATIVGKANMEAFSLGAGTAGRPDFGRVLHPLAADRSPGGSSSGSAAAVASGLADLAFGGDQGGSIRVPAAWCGVVGLKATHGLVPHTGVCGLEESVDHVGPMARRVEGVARALACVAGPDGYDPRQRGIPEPLPDYIAAVGRGIRGLRVGVLEQGFAAEAQQPVIEEVHAAIEALRTEGTTLSVASNPLHGLGQLASTPFVLERSAVAWRTGLSPASPTEWVPGSLHAELSEAFSSRAHELPLSLRMLVVAGSYASRRYHGRLAARSANVRRGLRRAYDELFDTVDVLVMPTVQVLAPVHDAGEGHEEALRLGLSGRVGMPPGLVTGNTWPFNFTGHPAMSVPCGAVDGLPVGLQIVAPRFREDLILAVGAAVERVADQPSPPHPARHA